MGNGVTREFQFSVVHKPGKLHTNADASSRLVVHDQSTHLVTDKSDCAISLNPTVNLRQAQQEDPIISQVIQMKTASTSKHKLVRWRHDPDLVTFWHHYDMFVCSRWITLSVTEDQKQAS